MKTEENNSSLISAAHAGMHEYEVTLYGEPGDNGTIKFVCWAEDAGHAGEQALDNYPHGELITCTRKEKNPYIDEKLMGNNLLQIKKSDFWSQALVKFYKGGTHKLVILDSEADSKQHFYHTIEMAAVSAAVAEAAVAAEALQQFGHSIGKTSLLADLYANSMKEKKKILLAGLKSNYPHFDVDMNIGMVDPGPPKSKNQERREALAKLPGNRKKMRF